MSIRNNLPPQAVIPSPQGQPANSADMTMNIISAPTILKPLTLASYEASWVGTAPTGTLSVQGSNSYSINPEGVVNNAGIWTTITLLYNGTLVTTIPVTGNTGNILINLSGIGCYAVRLVYTAATGLGTLSAIVTGKVS
jgi:hypothetical protein